MTTVSRVREEHVLVLVIANPVPATICLDQSAGLSTETTPRPVTCFSLRRGRNFRLSVSFGHSVISLSSNEYAGQIASVTPFLRNDTSFLRCPTTAAILPDLQGPVKVRWNPPVLTTIDQHKPIMAAAN
jgi:hypothetical protein